MCVMNQFNGNCEILAFAVSVNKLNQILMLLIIKKQVFYINQLKSRLTLHFNDTVLPSKCNKILPIFDSSIFL